MQFLRVCKYLLLWEGGWQQYKPILQTCLYICIVQQQKIITNYSTLQTYPQLMSVQQTNSDNINSQQPLIVTSTSTSTSTCIERVHEAYMDALLLRIIYIDMANTYNNTNTNIKQEGQELKMKIIHGLMYKLKVLNHKQMANIIGQAYHQASVANYQPISRIQNIIQAVIIDIILNNNNDNHNDNHDDSNNHSQYSQFSIVSDENKTSQQVHDYSNIVTQQQNTMPLCVMLQMSKIEHVKLKKQIAIQTDKSIQYVQQQQQTDNTSDIKPYQYIDTYLNSLPTCRHQINILCQHMKYQPVQYIRYMHNNKYYVQATLKVQTSIQLHYYTGQGWSVNYKHACEQAAYVLLRKVYTELPGLWRRFLHVKRVKGIL